MSGNHPKLVLDLIKTQTRRVIKPQPQYVGGYYHTDKIGVTEERAVPQTWLEYGCPYGQVGDRLWVRVTHYRCGQWRLTGELTETGKPEWDFYSSKGTVFYSDGPPSHITTNMKLMGWWKRPSIFMPRWASRITLEITEVRVERVQEITAYDALQEGIELPVAIGCEIPEPPPEYEGWSEERRENWIKGQARATYFARCADAQDHVDKFQDLWDSLNAK
ncbi:hypothetical protein LCGC14_2454730, partial [marine sediment metagenome]